MPAVLKHMPCPSCGHQHHFTLPVGDLVVGRDYEYVCPETDTRTSLRPTAAAEAVAHGPQGAVQLAPAGEGRPRGPGAGR